MFCDSDIPWILVAMSFHYNLNYLSAMDHFVWRKLHDSHFYNFGKSAYVFNACQEQPFIEAVLNEMTKHEIPLQWGEDGDKYRDIRFLPRRWYHMVERVTELLMRKHMLKEFMTNDEVMRFDYSASDLPTVEHIRENVLYELRPVLLDEWYMQSTEMPYNDTTNPKWFPCMHTYIEHNLYWRGVIPDSTPLWKFYQRQMGIYVDLVEQAYNDITHRFALQSQRMRDDM